MAEPRHGSRLRAGETGELELVYQLDERIPLGGAAPYRHVERWVVSVRLDRHESGDGSVEIGYVHVLIFNLEAGVDIGDLVDHASGAWVDVQVSDREVREPGNDGRRSDDHVLLLDRVWLEPGHRGRSLGPIVAAAVMERLGRGCRIAACYPAPFEDISQSSEDRGRSIEALAEIWSRVGFRPWRDGVWMLDLRETDMHAVLVGLLAARSRGVPGS